MLTFVLALTAALPFGQVSAAPSSVMRADTKGCRLVVPADLGSGPVTWVGDCPGGMANGLGVVRVGGGTEPRLFAGSMRAGHPVAGYLDTGSADSAGPSLHFRGADGLPTRNRAEARQACQIAARGARFAAVRYRATGNAGSAKFYGDWSKTLRHCEGMGE